MRWTHFKVVREVVGLLILGSFCDPVLTQDLLITHSPLCLSVLKEKKLPVKLKLDRSSKIARWDQVDEVLAGLDRDLKALGCEFKFNELFEADREELYIPLTNNVVRIVPESSLSGLSVFNTSGVLLGKYAGRVQYTRTMGLERTHSYTLYYFQFQDSDGEIHTSGSQLLLDSYRVKWKDIAERVGLSSKTHDN